MRVVIAGAGSPAGIAAGQALAAAGHEVVPVTRAEADLSDLDSVRSFAERVGAVDGLIHLVGGWRGGGGLAGQSDEDWNWLSERIVGTLRNTTRAFLPALLASPAPRVAIVSTTGIERPTAANANYVAAKAAAEAWLSCVGHALRDTPGRVEAIRVMALVSAADRAANPDRDYSRYTDVSDLAQQFVALWR